MTEITLFGFNNLTKNLSFSLYKLHYVGHQRDNYDKYIKGHYNADKLNLVLTNICHAIGGNVLSISKQDYHPQGASVTLMISEDTQGEPLPNIQSESLVAHLDKSHLCIHTYPEESPQHDIAIFRADIELSTCGIISPLKVLNHVIKVFDADVIDIDYRIRGMTRDNQGKKLFNTDVLYNISDFLSNEMYTKYQINEQNLNQQNLFYTKLARKNISLKSFIFKGDIEALGVKEQHKITRNIAKEIQQLFTNTN